MHTAHEWCTQHISWVMHTATSHEWCTQQHLMSDAHSTSHEWCTQQHLMSDAHSTSHEWCTQHISWVMYAATSHGWCFVEDDASIEKQSVSSNEKCTIHCPDSSSFLPLLARTNAGKTTWTQEFAMPSYKVVILRTLHSYTCMYTNPKLCTHTLFSSIVLCSARTFTSIHTQT
jgi:hypothetical protein